MGSQGNIVANTLLRNLVPNLAITQVAVDENGISGGFDEEDWQELRLRVLARIRQLAHGGAAFDYQEWLKAKFNVYAVNVVADWIGRGSVALLSRCAMVKPAEHHWQTKLKK